MFIEHIVCGRHYLFIWGKIEKTNNKQKLLSLWSSGSNGIYLLFFLSNPLTAPIISTKKYLSWWLYILFSILSVNILAYALIISIGDYRNTNLYGVHFYAHNSLIYFIYESQSNNVKMFIIVIAFLTFYSKMQIIFMA